MYSTSLYGIPVCGTVQHNYSVVRVLCTVLVHCTSTVRTVQCTSTVLSYYTNRVRPCHPICRLALLPVCTAVQYCIPYTYNTIVALYSTAYLRVYRTDSAGFVLCKSRTPIPYCLLALPQNSSGSSSLAPPYIHHMYTRSSVHPDLRFTL